MKLIDLKISEYLDMLLAGAFVPGKGCVSGLAGAQAAALLYRTADSLIREEAEGCDRTELENVRKEAERLYMDIAGAMEENTEESSARIMEAALSGLKKAEKISRCSHRQGSAYLGAAAANFIAALRGAWIDILREEGQGDENAENNNISKGRQLLEEGEKAAGTIYGEAEKRLMKERI